MLNAHKEASHMPIRLYFPISVAVFVLVIAAVHHFSFPILPFALILLAGETLLGFQLEDHKVPRLMGRLFKGLKSRY
jgi:hypothetical protein